TQRARWLVEARALAPFGPAPAVLERLAQHVPLVDVDAAVAPPEQQEVRRRAQILRVDEAAAPGRGRGAAVALGSAVEEGDVEVVAIRRDGQQPDGEHRLLEQDEGLPRPAPAAGRGAVAAAIARHPLDLLARAPEPGQRARPLPRIARGAHEALEGPLDLHARGHVGDLVGVGPAERGAPQLAGAGRAQQLERVEKVLPGARGAVAADSVVQPSGAAGERLAVAAAAPRAAGGPAFERLEQREDRAVERPRWRGVEPAPGAPGPRSKQLREREPRGERALLDVALEGAPQRLDGLVEARQGEGLGQGPGRSEAAR